MPVLDRGQVSRKEVGSRNRGASDPERTLPSFLELPDGLHGFASFTERRQGVGKQSLAGRSQPGSAAGAVEELRGQ